jgi:hypothetical protein
VDLCGAAGGPCGDHQQICLLDPGGGLGRHQMPGAGADLGLHAHYGRMPGGALGDLVGHRVRKVQYVEDRGESRVEHAILDQDCYLDVGNTINRGVSAADVITGPRLPSWCTGQIRCGWASGPAC